MGIERLVRDEEGFTTAGMAIALLLTLSLLFTSAQVYRVNSRAAEVQDVADAVALAAENEVAEFMVAVRLCDSVVLSLSLVGITSYGLGVVALCVPPAASLGGKLIDLGAKVLKARDTFAGRAAKGLNQLQKALPFLAAAQGAAVALANGKNRSSPYLAMGMLVPARGKPIVIGANKAEEDMEDAVDEGADDLAAAAERADEAARKANEAKQRAFERDCGDAPGYCMYERASKLASLGSASNPLYRSVDTWSFAVPLARARAYYRARLAAEAPAGSSTEEQARSALRKRFYAFAVQELAGGYVYETEDRFEARFPRLPRNTDQMRNTSLYTEKVYPVSRADEESPPVMHAWDGCPGNEVVEEYGSARMLEAGGYDTCEFCQFKVSLLGSVASASTSIDNGFEHHYDAVARAADDYKRAIDESRPLTDEVKQDAEGLFDEVLKAIKGAGSQRITARPPGADGCIALVVCPGGSSEGLFEGVFVSGSTVLGTRAAVAASTLVEDTTDEASVVGDLLDGLKQKTGVLGGAAGLVLDCWAGALGVYGAGQKALMEGLENALNALPLVGASGLGTWAADALSDMLKKAGLEPARDAPLKPVLVSSGAVAAKDTGGFGVRYQKVRELVLKVPASSTDPFLSLADAADNVVLEQVSGQIEIARIELPFGGLSWPITVTLPPSLSEGIMDVVRRGTDALRSLGGKISGLKPWQ